jgi:hypothetical protein
MISKRVEHSFNENNLKNSSSYEKKVASLCAKEPKCNAFLSRMWLNQEPISATKILSYATLEMIYKQQTRPKRPWKVAKPLPKKTLTTFPSQKIGNIHNYVGKMEKIVSQSISHFKHVLNIYSTSVQIFLT